jgi:hypothetical protein
MKTGRDPERLGQPAVVEDEDHHPERGAGREQVEDDRLDGDDDRAEGHEHEHEREAQDEGKDPGRAVDVDLGDVEGHGDLAADEHPDAVLPEVAEELGPELVANGPDDVAVGLVVAVAPEGEADEGRVAVG